MDQNTDYTTVRIKREIKFDIERIAAQHYRDTGEKLDAGQVIEKAIEFLKAIVFPEPESEKA